MVAFLLWVISSGTFVSCNHLSGIYHTTIFRRKFFARYVDKDLLTFCKFPGTVRLSPPRANKYPAEVGVGTAF